MAEPLTLEDAQEFIALAPWRAVKAIAGGPANKPPDPHEYVIFGWQDVPREQVDGFVALIRAEGYRGRYTPPYDPSKTMTNDYLQIDDWIYWFIYPRMLNRQRADHRQHEVIAE